MRPGLTGVAAVGVALRHRTDRSSVDPSAAMGRQQVYPVASRPTAVIPICTQSYRSSLTANGALLSLADLGTRATFSVARGPGPRSRPTLAGQRLGTAPATVITDQAVMGSASARATTANSNPAPCRPAGSAAQRAIVVVRWWPPAGAGPIRGTLAAAQPGRWRRGSAGEQEPLARERGPENAGDASALPQPTRHASLGEQKTSRAAAMRRKRQLEIQLRP